MRYGKIKIEDGNLIFSKHMILNYLPCKDIIWAYMRREGVEGGEQKQFSTSSLVILTKRHKRYQFEMTEKEVQEALQFLRALNPKLLTGYPRGGRVHLRSLPNTRDLGAYATEDGHHVLPKKLLRSGSLYHLSISDQDTLLEDYRLTRVIDFRTKTEQEQKPDTVMAGVKYANIPILDEETMGISQAGGLMDMFRMDMVPDDFILKQYEALVRDPFCVKEYARFMDMILHHEDGAILWHCSAGKDRVGVGTAILLSALGVPRETICDDYMKTNLYLDDEMQHMIRILETKMIVDNEAMDKIRLLFKVKREYIDAAFSAIEEDYGSMEEYLHKAMYMSAKNIEELRKKYLI